MITEVGIYLICNGGYLRWRTLICPFKHASINTPEGYFSKNLERVRKDVECIFGILKKRWRLLDYGIRFRDIKVADKIFVTCCILHNMMLSEVQREYNNSNNRPRIGRGCPIDGSAMWLEGPTEAPPMPPSDRAEATRWGIRRKALVDHYQHLQQSAKRTRREN